MKSNQKVTKSQPITFKVSRAEKTNSNDILQINLPPKSKQTVVDGLIHLLEKHLNQSDEDSEKEDGSPKKCIIYLRCSSKKQNDQENGQHGFDTQEQDCIQYANANGFEIIDTIKQTRRATSMNGLDILEIPKRYEGINIILADPSRLSRSYAEGTKFIEDCEAKKIVLHFARDNISSDTTVGKKMILNLLIDANEESKIFSKRVRSAIRQKQRYGSKMGCAKYGFELYRVNTEGFPIMKERPREDEQKIIKLISMYYFGTEMKPFYELFATITNNHDFKMIYQENNEEKEYENIQYGYFTYSDVARFLNDNNIQKRGKVWVERGVKNVIDSLIDYLTDAKQPIIYYHEKGITKQFFHEKNIEIYLHDGTLYKKIKYNGDGRYEMLYNIES